MDKANAFPHKKVCDKRAKNRTKDPAAECECLKEEPEIGCRGCAFGEDAPLRGAKVKMTLTFTDEEAPK